MYITYSAFETAEDAENIVSKMMQHSEFYINAPTSNVYIGQFYAKQS